MEKSNKVTLFSSIILIGFTFGVIYHYILAYYMHYGEPFTSFLYQPSWAFCDFFDILSRIKDFKPYQEVTLWIVYFPLAYILMFPFSLIKNSVFSYILYSSGFVLYWVFMSIKCFFCKNLTKIQNVQNIFIIIVLSYPFLNIMDKGNFDMFLFVMMGFWAYTFKDEKYTLSAVILAIINAIKPFSILFLFLYLFKKKYKEFLLSIILSILFVIGGFMIFSNGFFNQINIFLKSLTLFKLIYAIKPVIRIECSSSLFIPVKAIFLHFSTSTPGVINFIKIYDKVCYIITAFTLFFVWKEKVFWKQLTLLICNFLLLPYITYDYKLMFLFIPLWLFINETEKFKFDLAYIICFSLLFIPKNIIIILNTIHNNSDNWFPISAIINPLILITLSLLIIYEQYENKKEKVV